MELVPIHSLCVLQLEALAATKAHLGFATGVIVKCAGRTFIVTNYHVLAGRHPYTDRSGPAVPEFLRVKDRMHRAGIDLPEMVQVEHPLRDDNLNPLWFALPKEERILPVEPNGVKLAVDVAVLEVRSIPQNFGFLQFDRPREFHIPVMEQVGIVGYPHNLSGTEDFPMWLSGTVASDLANRPYRKCFFVDARTRPACSGSLVVLRTRGAKMEYAGGWMDRSGNVFYAIGIYSGRITEDSDIGLVWHWNTLEQTFERIIPLKEQDWKTAGERMGHAAKVPINAPSKTSETIARPDIRIVE